MKTLNIIVVALLVAVIVGISVISFLLMRQEKSGPDIPPKHIVKTCSSNADCAWVSTNCCPENAGAHWECINAKLSHLDCPVNPVCLQVISPKPEKACKCINGICTAEH